MAASLPFCSPLPEDVLGGTRSAFCRRRRFRRCSRSISASFALFINRLQQSPRRAAFFNELRWRAVATPICLRREVPSMFRNLSNRMTAPRFARILAIIGTVVAIYLHILFGMNAGALWRDEVSTLEVATMRTFAEMWANLSFESFPALFFVILRLFAGVPASVSDGSLRVFGAAIGLLVLFAVWLNARWLRLGVPLITLALIGFNPMVIRYGDSIRAYGLGILLALLTIGAMWRLIESFTLRRVIVALVIAVLSVQACTYDAVLLLALCLTAATVMLRRRQIVRALDCSCNWRGRGRFVAPYIPTVQRVRSGSSVCGRNRFYPLRRVDEGSGVSGRHSHSVVGFG